MPYTVAGLPAVALDSGPQPGERAPAPGALALVQAFVNSHYDLEREHGAELLADPAGLRRWLRRRRLIAAGAQVSDDDLATALAVREGLRALLLANNGEPLDRRAARALDVAASSTPVSVRLGRGDPDFAAPSADARGALGLILAIAARARLDGSFARLKACPGHDCGWAFFDHSRNAAGSWCSMAVCGGRAKQRAYYRRRRYPAPRGSRGDRSVERDR
jgi:predicted RNA-binding Zn ribbon-like protein